MLLVNATQHAKDFWNLCVLRVIYMSTKLCLGSVEEVVDVFCGFAS